MLSVMQMKQNWMVCQNKHMKHVVATNHVTVIVCRTIYYFLAYLRLHILVMIASIQVRNSHCI